MALVICNDILFLIESFNAKLRSYPEVRPYFVAGTTEIKGAPKTPQQYRPKRHFPFRKRKKAIAICGYTQVLNARRVSKRTETRDLS